MNKPIEKKRKKPKTDPKNILDEVLVDYSNTSSGEQVESEPPSSIRSKRKSRALAIQSAEPLDLNSIITSDVDPESTTSNNEVEKEILDEKHSSTVSAPVPNSVSQPLPVAVPHKESRISRVYALVEQVKANFISKNFETPTTFVEIEALHEILTKLVLKNRLNPKADDNAYYLSVQAAFSAFNQSKCGLELKEEISKDEKRNLMSGVLLNWFKPHQNALWIFLALLGTVLDGSSFIYYFKKKEFTLAFLQKYREFLLSKKDESLWSLEPFGFKSLTQEFLNTDGLEYFQLVDPLDDFDERINSYRPIKKKEKPSSTIITSDDAKSSSSKSNMIVQQAHDCLLKALDKVSIEEFLNSIRKNQVQFPGWVFDTKLLDINMAQRLDNMWYLNKDRLEMTSVTSWRELDCDDFIFFMERLASSSHGGSKRESILSELHRKLKGLTFDALSDLRTLDQIVPFQVLLTREGISLSIAEKKLIDQIIFDGLSYTNCSKTIKNTIKSLKSNLEYDEKNPAFHLLFTAASEANDAKEQGQKALDWFDLAAWEREERPKIGSLFSASDNANDNQQRPPKNSKKKVRNHPSSSSQQQSYNHKSDSNKPCTACGFDGHSSDKCRFLANPK